MKVWQSLSQLYCFICLGKKRVCFCPFPKQQCVESLFSSPVGVDKEQSNLCKVRGVREDSGQMDGTGGFLLKAAKVIQYYLGDGGDDDI